MGNVFISNGEDNEINNISPGDTIDVVHYDIYIDNVDTEADTIVAHSKLLLTPKLDNISTFTLELLSLTIDSILIDNSPPASYNHYDPLLEIELNNAINTGDTIEVSIYYHGQPFHENWGGYHFSGDYSFNLGVGFISIPHNLGKAWFPCVDDFTDRATYDFYITVSDDETAVCGGTLVEVTEIEDNKSTFHWELHQTIPTYLASVATGEYYLYEDKYNGLEGEKQITIYTKPNDSTDIEGSFAHLKNITNIFETYFGPYKWDRIGYVGTAIGAMEHATNIAYPNSCINGNLTYEYLIAHELSHMWFGDLVTCESAQEMWLNEGWATFCEMFYREKLYSQEDFIIYMRATHADVLQYCHTSSGDGDYYKLNDIPQEYTYGMTAYDKGATIVQSIRAYLRDSLFYEGVKSYLDEYAFNSASSYDLRDELTNATGIDMTDFFDNWVFNRGTPHFSIDSFKVASEDRNDYETHIYLKQKRKGYDFLGNSNIVEVTFMDDDWNTHTDTVHFSGRNGHSVKTVPFETTVAFVDLMEKTYDATTDEYKVISNAGNYKFSETFCKIQVEDINDSAFVRVVHNWIAPDTLIDPVPGFKLSDYRYWQINGIFPEGFNATARFFYSKDGFLDNTLIKSDQDSVVILYRSNAGEKWQETDFYREGVWNIGYLYVENLQPGQYALGAWDTEYVGEDKPKTQDKKKRLKVYPNPSDRSFNIIHDFNENSMIKVFGTSGNLIEVIEVPSNKTSVTWDANNLSNGAYYLVLIQDAGNHIIREKVVLK